MKTRGGVWRFGERDGEGILTLRCGHTLSIALDWKAPKCPDVPYDCAKCDEPMMASDVRISVGGVPIVGFVSGAMIEVEYDTDSPRDSNAETVRVLPVKS